MGELLWSPTPYRKRTDDEVADVAGFGRFRVCYDRHAKKFFLSQNNERIGSWHDTPEAAKSAAENIVEASK